MGETLKQKYPQCLEEIKILNVDNADYIANILSKIFNTKYTLDDEEIHEGDCQVKAIYTKEAFRAIAKIAFNYLAYSNDTSLIIQECFALIRNFIVEGKGEWDQFIKIEKDPVVADMQGMAADVHLLTLYANGRSIYSSVSLHNKIHYKICLTSSYEGKSFEVGHCFDPHRHKIHKLGKISLVLAKALPLTIQLIKPFIWISV